MLKNLIKDELIFTDHSFNNHNELFDHIQINATNYVTNQFSEKLSERELQFPTGLELSGINVAIPHTDSEYVKEQFIALYTLEKSIPFKRMDDPSSDTNVNVVFVLGLNEPHAQLEVLQSLMGKMQDEAFINNLVNLKNKNEILKQF
ncbi:PTS sugar transporter subunit IIA [Macrococcus armenti]|uniref:PTS sugar transporter subunit IIA n=1 Tax=Macrococcus armenti TaxID=2875764 RepID=UPI001CCE0946|nr:PTS sugar transporter subunit IIA [Macrococcus armenti]UBH08057.1 PTS sugar transporter subunit IIA [Macrococcus armenti]UBH10289.1 PTS sugar transporter subunit IIA [Macrococcus armenti]